MKITIETNIDEKISLSPAYVYKKLCDEYWYRKSRESGLKLWGMATACDAAARELYSNIKQRRSNVHSLILTYSDAEDCFSFYKQFVDVWVKNVLDCKREGG